MTSRHRIARSSVVVAIVTAVVAVALASPAFAMGQTPVPSWMIGHGKVLATAVGGGRIYLGGQFTELRSTPVGVPGTRVLVDNLAAIDVSTGSGITSFSPHVTHSTDPANVRALAVSPDGGTLFLGGHFDAVNGIARRNVAAIDTATGAVKPDFDPVVGTAANQVYALMVSTDGSRLYVGGQFNRVNGQARSHAAAVSTVDGTTLAWSPQPAGRVRGMTNAPDGQTIFIVGSFASVAGVSRESIARVDAITGALHPWAVPGQYIDGPPMNGFSVDVSATTVYAGFGKTPNWFAGFSMTTGIQTMRTNTVGNVQKVMLSPDGTQLFVGGHFGTGELRQRFSNCGDQLFYALLVANPVTGAVDCSWVPQLEPNTNNYHGIWDLERTSGHLWFAGKFTSVNGVKQSGIARAAW
jgi:hypothetical protein